MNDSATIRALRGQMSNIGGVFALSMMLFDRVEADDILKLVGSALPALGPCHVVGTYVLPGPASPGGLDDLDADLRSQVTALAGADGAVALPDAKWAWAYPLCSVGGHAGYLVASADARPSTDEQFLVRTLTQQAGAALHSAALYHGERNASEELRDRNSELATVNEQLRDAIAELERRNRMHELFTRVAATGGAEPEIAAALRELTGLAVIVEDPFGNLLGWAGGSSPSSGSARPGTTASC